MEERHFWFQARSAVVLQLLPRHLPPPALLCDVGCGTGRMVASLRQIGYTAVGLDPLLAGAARQAGGPARCFLRARSEELPLRERSIDGVLLLDVLEHAEDAAALAEARRVLRPAGCLVLTVPALPWL